MAVEFESVSKVFSTAIIAIIRAMCTMLSHTLFRPPRDSGSGDDEQNPDLCWDSNSGHPAYSHSYYWPRY